jgi:hypothetical protein
MKPKRIRFTLHLCGREIFSLSFEWIKSNLWKGQELATPLLHGDNYFRRALWMQAILGW